MDEDIPATIFGPSRSSQPLCPPRRRISRDVFFFMRDPWPNRGTKNGEKGSRAD